MVSYVSMCFLCWLVWLVSAGGAALYGVKMSATVIGLSRITLQLRGCFEWWCGRLVCDSFVLVFHLVCVLFSALQSVSPPLCAHNATLLQLQSAQGVRFFPPSMCMR